MFGDDAGSAAARRDAGIRRITRITWRAGVLSVIGSALIAVAFGHQADARAAHRQQGTILVPNQAPRPAPGAGQVTSGSS